MIEDRIHDDLERIAGGVSDAGRPLPRGVRRRIRGRQAALGAGAAFAVVGALFVFAALPLDLGSTTTGDRVRPAAQPPGPHARDVFVLDPEARGLSSRILALEPRSRGALLRSYRAGFDPAMEVSADGRRLFVASTKTEEPGSPDILEVIDVESGSVEAAVKVPNRVHNTGRTCCPDIALSPGGDRLYLLQATPGNEYDRTYGVATYVTASETLLPESLPLDACFPGSPVLMPDLGGWDLAVICQNTHDVRLFNVGADGGASNSAVVDLPQSDDASVDANGNPLELWRVAWAVPANDRSSAIIVTKDGNVYELEAAERTVEHRGRVDIANGVSVQEGKVAITPDGASLVVGAGPVDHFDFFDADRLYVVDLADLSSTEILTTRTYWSFAVAAEGDRVFATSPRTQEVLVVDLTDGSEGQSIRGVGNAPQLAEVPVSDR